MLCEGHYRHRRGPFSGTNPLVRSCTEPDTPRSGALAEARRAPIVARTAAFPPELAVGEALVTGPTGGSVVSLRFRGLGSTAGLTPR